MALVIRRAEREDTAVLFELITALAPLAPAEGG